MRDWYRQHGTAYAREWRRRHPDRVRETLDIRSACRVTAGELGMEARENRTSTAFRLGITRQAVEQIEGRALFKLALALLPATIRWHMQTRAALPGWALRIGRQYRKMVDNRARRVSKHPPMPRHGFDIPPTPPAT